MPQRSWYWALAIAAGVGLGGPALAAGQAPDKDEQQFVMGAAQGDQAEIKLGKLALAHAQTPAVKAFARRMIDDHTRALAEVRKLAEQLAITLPKEPTSELNGIAEQLGKLKGAAFERSYLDAMITDHTHDVQEFKQESQDAKTPSIKAMAKKQLLVLQAHLKLAQDTRRKLG